MVNLLPITLTVWTKTPKTYAYSVLQHAYVLTKKNECFFDNEHTCPSDHLLCQLHCFFSKTKEGKVEATSSQIQCPVYSVHTVALYWRGKIYIALRFDCLNFFNIAHLHFVIFSMENNVMCYCFREPIKTFIFWRLSNAVK